MWKVEDAVESLSREILTIQAKGNKPAAWTLLQSRATLTQPLHMALEKIEHMQVPWRNLRLIYVGLGPEFTASLLHRVYMCDFSANLYSFEFKWAEFTPLFMFIPGTCWYCTEIWHSK